MARLEPGGRLHKVGGRGDLQQGTASGIIQSWSSPWLRRDCRSGEDYDKADKMRGIDCCWRNWVFVG